MALFKTVADLNGGTQVEMTAEEEAAFIALQEAAAAAQPRLDIITKITTLEATITPRRRNEAYAGTDGGWLTNVINQIAALRAQL